MKKKKNKLILSLLLIGLVFIISGCKKDEPEIINMSNGTSTSSDNYLENVDVNSSGSLLCKREAILPSGMEGNFKYSLTYKKGIITILHSMEKVVSSNSSQLDEYEKSYKTIKDNYKDLKYYDITVTRDTNSVTFDSIIYYNKLDFDKLIEIEGNDNNLYDDNQLRLKTWYNYVKDFGVTCQGVVS